MEKMTIDGVEFMQTSRVVWETGDTRSDGLMIFVVGNSALAFDIWHGGLIIRSDYDFPEAKDAAEAAIAWLKANRPELYRELCGVAS